jgi:hypothetical protein
MTAARVRRIAEEIAVARCKAAPDVDARAVALRALEDAQQIEATLYAADACADTPRKVDELTMARARKTLRRKGIGL